MRGVRLLQIAASYMVLGLGLGLAMGISGNFSLTSVHAHLLLLGWATMAIAGIVYLVLPDCARSRLATFHFWGHNLGMPIMLMSLAMKVNGQEKMEPLIGASSTLVLVSLVFFAINLFQNAGINREYDCNEDHVHTQVRGRP
jgi:cbb3-type cytochrome oxidase subunit 1